MPLPEVDQTGQAFMQDVLKQPVPTMESSSPPRPPSPPTTLTVSGTGSATTSEEIARLLRTLVAEAKGNAQYGWVDHATVALPEGPWAVPCEAMFEHLAANQFVSLLRLIQQGTLTPGDMTFAAEIAGREADAVTARQAIRTLIPLLGSPAPLTREGAILGLSHLQAYRDAVGALRGAASTDPEPSLRELALELLEEPT
jgi:hypothetical protein